MAQEFHSSIPDGQTSVKQDNINSRKNELTLRSNYSGTSYPDNPTVGQRCYREDIAKEYVYTVQGWQEPTDISTVGRDISLAKGGFTSLTEKLAMSIDDDGSLKNPTTANVSEWKTMASVPTYVSATQFWLENDVTTIFTQGRGVKCIVGLQVVYTSVVSSEHDSVNSKTFVNVKDAVLTNELSNIEYGLIQYSMGGVASKAEVTTDIATHNTSETAHEDIRTAITDVLQVAQGITDLTSRVSTLEADSDFTIIYPNGGTKEAPANITVNSRYVMDSPFPGYEVNAKTEVKINGTWYELTKVESSVNYYGAITTQLNNELVLVTAEVALVYPNMCLMGMALPPGSISSNIVTAPCRVKVWKVGKI